MLRPTRFPDRIRPPSRRANRSGYLAWFVVIGGLLSALALTLYGIFGDSKLSAHSEWLKFAKELKNQDEPVYVADVKPTDVPPAQNFFAANVFAGLAEGAPSSPLLQCAINPGKGLSVTDLLAAATSGDGANLDAIVNAMQQTELLRAKPEFLLAGDRVRFGMHALGIDFTLLMQAADRPASRFGVDYSQLFPKLPHLRYLEALGDWLAIHAIAQLSTGDTENAALDISLISRLADSISTEPFLLSQRTRRLLLGLFAGCVRIGIDWDAWSDEQLTQFGNILERPNLIADLGWALRGDRAQLNSAIHAALVGQKSAASDALMDWLGSDLAQLDMRSLRTRQIEANRAIQQLLDNMMAPGGLKPAVLEPLVSESSSPTVCERLKEFTNDVRISSQVQTYLLQAKVACALERSRFVHGTYPDKLDELTPKWLPAVPNDPVTDGQFGYEHKPDGGFVLIGAGGAGEKPWTWTRSL